MSTPTDQEVIIRILTAFEKGGIDEAMRVAQELQQTVESNSSSGKTLSGVMDLLNSKGSDAGTVFKSLAGVMKGGGGAAANLGSAIKGLGAAFGWATGPVGLLASLVTAGVTAWQSWKSSAEEAAEASRKAAEEAEAAAKQAAEALEKDMAAAADAVTAKLKGITDELKAGTDQANKLSDATAAVGDAQHELELARLDAKLVGVTDEGEIAKIKQEKTRLKAGWERQKLFDDSAAKRGELGLMDREEDRYKDEAAERNWELSQAEHRWSGEQAAAESRVSAAQVALETAQGNLATPQTTFNPAVTQQLNFAVHQAKQELSAAEAALQETTDRIAKERSVLESAADTANQRYDDLVAAHAPQRQIIQKQIDANTIKGQTIETALFASEHQYDLDEKARDKAKKEADAKAQKEAAEERDKNMGNDERIRRAQSLVLPEQRVGEKLYGGESGIETQRLARSAIADAGRQIAAGEEKDKIILELVDVLRGLGARSSNTRALVAEIAKIKKDLQETQSQVAHLR